MNKLETESLPLSSSETLEWLFENPLTPKKPFSNIQEIVKTVLESRGVSGRENINFFLNPPHPSEITPEQVGISKKEFGKAISRIKKAMNERENIVVYTDTDVDGINSGVEMVTALKQMGARAEAFVPDRKKEGYGLSKIGIDKILENNVKFSLKKGGLIVTVDSGILAHEAVEYARTKGIDVIIVDHHKKGRTVPDAAAVVHTTELCASGISYFLVKELLGRENSDWALELAAIATVTDIMKLHKYNRAIVKHGLSLLRTTDNQALRQLFHIAGVKNLAPTPEESNYLIDTHTIGYYLGPRINAAGRMEHAQLAYDLLVADMANLPGLSVRLEQANISRQDITKSLTEQAVKYFRETVKDDDRIIFYEIDEEAQGVAGLIAGKLVGEFNLPAIVVAPGQTLARGSARSVKDFDITDALHSLGNDVFESVGGHTMAAGFALRPENMERFRTGIKELARIRLPKKPKRPVEIVCGIDFSALTPELFNALKDLEPFGEGFPKPMFASWAVVEDKQLITSKKDGSKHTKIIIKNPRPEKPDRSGNDPRMIFFRPPTIECMAFYKPEYYTRINIGEKVIIAYHVNINNYGGETKLQLDIKHIKWTN